MSYIYDGIPFFECLVRAEFTRDLRDRHGELYPAVAHAVRCVRGHSLWFQVILTEKHGGAAFLLPIEALCWRACPHQPAAVVQPWDTFSSNFGVSEIAFVGRGAVAEVRSGIRGQYRFTIDFIGSDLAEYPDQHKHLHVCLFEDGSVRALPNNRLLWSDPAWWATTTEKPDFLSLSGEFRAEGNQQMFGDGNRRPGKEH